MKHFIVISIDTYKYKFTVNVTDDSRYPAVSNLRNFKNPCKALTYVNELLGRKDLKNVEVAHQESFEQLSRLAQQWATN